MKIIRYQDLTIAIFCHLCEDRLPKFTEYFFQVSCMRDCNTVFDETSVDKSNTPESDTTINNTSGVTK
jgi:hypothetical protein